VAGREFGHFPANTPRGAGSSLLVCSRKFLNWKNSPHVQDTG
jgi:hypothetical protein